MNPHQFPVWKWRCIAESQEPFDIKMILAMRAQPKWVCSWQAVTGLIYNLWPFCTWQLNVTIRWGAQDFRGRLSFWLEIVLWSFWRAPAEKHLIPVVYYREPFSRNTISWTSSRYCFPSESVSPPIQGPSSGAISLDNDQPWGIN